MCDSSRSASGLDKVRIRGHVVIDAQESLIGRQILRPQDGEDGCALVQLVEHGAEDKRRLQRHGAVQLLLVERAVEPGEVVERLAGVRVAGRAAGPHDDAAVDAEAPQRAGVLGGLPPAQEARVPVVVVGAHRPGLDHVGEAIHLPVAAGLVLDELRVPRLLHAEDHVVSGALEGVDDVDGIVGRHLGDDAEAPDLDDGFAFMTHVGGRRSDALQCREVVEERLGHVGAPRCRAVQVVLNHETTAVFFRCCLCCV